MPEVKIIGTGSYIPSTTVENKALKGELDFDKELTEEEVDAWIREKEGIRERHYAIEESKLEECLGTDRLGNKIIRKIGASEYMAYMTILDILKSAGIKVCNKELSKVDRIHIGSFTGYWIINNSGGKVAWKLAPVGTPASTGNEACAGFLYGVEDIYNGIKAGRYRKGIVVGSETLSSVRIKDKTIGSLWGDVAGGMGFEASNERGVYPPYLDSIDTPNIELINPNNLESIIVDGREYVPKTYITMQGKDVFKRAVQAMMRSVFCALVNYKFGRAGDIYTRNHRPEFVNSYSKVKEEYERIGKRIIKEIDGIFLHQANQRITETTIEHLSIEDIVTYLSVDQRVTESIREVMENNIIVYVSIDKFGNTSSASIPFTIGLAVKNGLVKKGGLYVAAGVGGSYPAGGFVFRWLK